MQSAQTSLDLRQPQRRHSWLRRAGVRCTEVVARALGGRAFYRRRHLTPPGLRLRREILEVGALPADFEGFRVVHLSDLHAGPFIARGDLAALVEAVNALAPDVIAFTGDFITHRAEEGLALADDFGGLSARHGVFAVFGNHDYRERREGELVRAFGERGVIVLRNESRRIAREGGALCIVGIEDLEESKHIDLTAARALVQPGDFEIVLCHHPLGAPQFVRPRCIAVLAGHTHATQLDLPLVRRAGPAHPGARVDFGGTVLLVSRGLGVIGLPLRIGAPTEIGVVELRRKST